MTNGHSLYQVGGDDEDKIVTRTEDVAGVAVTLRE
jgi:hypothetical protein